VAKLFSADRTFELMKNRYTGTQCKPWKGIFVMNTD